MAIKGEENIITINFDGVDKNVKKIAIGVVILLVVGGIAFYLYGGTDVPDNGNGANAVRDNIQSVEQHNDTAIGELERAKSTISDLQATNEQLTTEVKRLRDTNQQLNNTITKLTATNQQFEQIINNGKSGTTREQELIEQGQRILEQVRARGQSGTK